MRNYKVATRRLQTKIRRKHTEATERVVSTKKVPMTKNGKETAEKPVKDGGEDGKQKKVNTMDNYIGKGKGVKGSTVDNRKNESVVVTMTPDAKENMKIMNEYWKDVVNGPSAKIVTVKQEKVESENQFDVLSDDEKDEQKDECQEVINETDEDIQQYTRISTDNLMELDVKEVEKMQVATLSEYVFQYMRCENHALERRQVYLKDEKWLRNTLRTAIKKTQTSEFIKHVDRLAKKLKTYDLEAENVDLSMGNLLKSIHVASQSTQEVEKLNVRAELKRIRDVVYLIESYVNNPLTMIPKETFQLNSCTKEEIMRKDYFTIVMALIYAKARVGNLLVTGMEDLRNEALELNRLFLKDKKTIDINNSPSKRSRKVMANSTFVTPTNDNKGENGKSSVNMEIDTKTSENENLNEEMEQERDMKSNMCESNISKEAMESEVKSSISGPTDEQMIEAQKRADEYVENARMAKEKLQKKKSSIEENMKKRREDNRKQAQNLNGMNIDNVVPTETITGPTFDFPEGKKVVNHISRTKSIYYLHNKIHVEGKVQAQEIVKMVFRVLRKADPTVVLVPFKKEEATMNNSLDKEEQVPETEDELMKWIKLADKQPYKKFAFSMRVHLTETPEVVKNRIFNWCRDRQHYIEFKQITTANILFAGWLYKIHKQFHNREELRNWMIKDHEVLKHELHLSPAQVFKNKGDDIGSKAITNGLRVEISFEKRNEIFRALYALNWSKGPYKGALFVPYRENAEFTKEMQLKFINKQNEYLNNVEQRVFKMKGPQWCITNKKNGEKTTFQKWLCATEVNSMKVIESVEVGNNDYVRIVYNKKYKSQIQYIMRHLHTTTKETFGEEVTEKLFSIMHGIQRGDMHDLEEAYSKQLQEALGGNPQMDEEDNAPIVPQARKQRQPQSRVYLSPAINETYATVAQTNTIANPKQEKQHINDEKTKGDIKDEIMKELKSDIDQRFDGMEKRVEKKINTIKIEQDAKIDSLADLVKTNHDKAEQAAVERDEKLQKQFELNNNKLVNTLAALFKSNGNSTESTGNMNTTNENPPIPVVEQGSHGGGGQK